MSELGGDRPVLLFKKLGGMILLIVGCLLAATGFGAGYNGLGMIGIVLLALGLVLLVLKIMRRNQVGP